MIISKIVGGLGNQMAQYAFARMHADRLNCPLLLDIRTLENSANIDSVTTREFQLNRFNIRFDGLATTKDVSDITRLSFFGKIISKLKPWYKRAYISEISHNIYPCYSPKYMKLTNNTYIEGYWINREYFAPTINVLRKEFTVKENLSEQNKKYLDIIRNTPSIAIHIRRGDYVGNPHFTIPALDYYRAAMLEVTGRISNLNYIFFSDDLEWVRSNFDAKNSVFIEGNENNPEIDIYLMSQVKHNILANSTFSWWGGILNANQDKIIFAPKIWYTNTNRQKNSFFIVPSEWQRI